MTLVTNDKFGQVADAIFSRLTQFSKFTALLVCIALELVAWLVIAHHSTWLAFSIHGITAIIFGVVVIIGGADDNE